MDKISHFLILLAENTQKSGDLSGPDLLRTFGIVAAVLFLGLFLMIRTHQRIARSNKNKKTVKQRLSHQPTGHDIYGQISELMAALADFSRQINGQIDTRIAKLQILMAQADKMIKQMEEHTGTSARELVDEAKNSSSDAIADIERINEQYREKIPPVAREDWQEKSTDEAKKGTENEDINNKNKQNNSIITKKVLELSDQGMSALEIAKETTRPIGEIELILSLQGRK